MKKEEKYMEEGEFYNRVINGLHLIYGELRKINEALDVRDKEEDEPPKCEKCDEHGTRYNPMGGQQFCKCLFGKYKRKKWFKEKGL